MSENDLVWMTIGKRDALTPQEAERMGACWREAVQRNPRAEFLITIDGYDDDQRELWQIPEVVSYVKLWAAAAGMADAATVQRLLGDQGYAFLGLCGVFGAIPQFH
jgi:hypothetical protein